MLVLKGALTAQVPPGRGALHLKELTRDELSRIMNSGRGGALADHRNEQAMKDRSEYGKYNQFKGEHE